MQRALTVAAASLVLMFALAACQNPDTGNTSESTMGAAMTPAQSTAKADPAPETAASAAPKAEVPPLLNFTMNDIEGKPFNLAREKGKVILFVNVASKCGYTPQYKGLEALYKKYKDQGLVIIGVPANNFHHQEPGTNAQIAAFCSSKYNVTFPMLSKVSVKGADQCPLYHALIAAADAQKLPAQGPVKWNFEKFLLNRQGQLVARFRSPVKPLSKKVTGAIEASLNS